MTPPVMLHPRNILMALVLHLGLSALLPSKGREEAPPFPPPAPVCDVVSDSTLALPVETAFRFLP